MYEVKPIETRYWMPGDDYIKIIVDAIGNEVDDGTIVAISEKAISIAWGNIIDESKVKASILAKFLARFWMRKVWGFVLAHLCHLSPKTLERLRNYPIELGGRHKEVALRRAGFLQALKAFSEGGIDASNLPYLYVSLPLPNPKEIAEKIRMSIKKELKKEVAVMIVDTDKTYSIRSLHLAPRRCWIRGLRRGSFFSYLLGRMFKLKMRATPLAIAGLNIDAEEALNVARLADKAFRYGAGRTVWDMAEKFGVGLEDVTWEMLQSIKHRPISIIRRHRG